VNVYDGERIGFVVAELFLICRGRSPAQFDKTSKCRKIKELCRDMSCNANVPFDCWLLLELDDAPSDEVSRHSVEEFTGAVSTAKTGQKESVSAIIGIEPERVEPTDDGIEKGTNITPVPAKLLENESAETLVMDPHASLGAKGDQDRAQAANCRFKSGPAMTWQEVAEVV
jgi:hypothetical protein